MRDEQIIKIRPELNIDTDSSNPIESFQNKTLRPILKLQHPLTLRLLVSSSHFNKKIQKVDLYNLDLLHKTIKDHIQSDNKLRSKILGSIVAMMTQSELDFYFDNETEINKRIMSMQIKRYTDSGSEHYRLAK